MRQCNLYNPPYFIIQCHQCVFFYLSALWMHTTYILQQSVSFIASQPYQLTYTTRSARAYKTQDSSCSLLFSSCSSAFFKLRPSGEAKRKVVTLENALYYILILRMNTSTSSQTEHLTCINTPALIYPFLKCSSQQAHTQPRGMFVFNSQSFRHGDRISLISIAQWHQSDNTRSWV